MSSNKQDVREYLEYTANGISGSVTRGIVVSTEDPLFSGRVKVWIPTLHGGFDEKDGKDPYLIEGVVDGKKVPLAGSVASMTPEAIQALPWALILGHNWGSIGKFAPSGVGNLEKINYGLFSVPRVGTEVMLIFENDDPDFPIILGSCIHRNDYLWNRKLSLEITPGLRVSVVEPKQDGDYAKEVANSYIIQASNGAKLLISDSLNREAIILTAPILTIPKNDNRNQLKNESIDYKIFTDSYPGFPTTASSPYVSTPTGSETFINGVLSSSTSLFDPLPSAPPVPSAGTGSDTPPPVTPPDSTPPETRNEKTWPVGVTFKDPTGGQMFGAPRPGSRIGKHVGIDLSVPAGTDLLAPIDGVVMFSYFSTQAGNVLCMKGLDGSIHYFDHLSSVDSSKTGKEVKIREKLGSTGGAVGTVGAGTNTTGAHLHWDIVMDPKNLVKTEVDARAFREACIIGGMFKANVIPAFSFTNPLEWVKNNSITTVTGDQLNSIIDHVKAQQTFDSLPQNEKYRNIGLEMSLVTGKEDIFLRHPSGSFLGFDVDGNFMLHTTGDANFKVGRSVNWNVFGGFLIDCLTLWHKVSTVARLYAMSFKHSKHIKDDEVEEASIPEFFKRNVKFKKADADNALAASLANTWIIDNKTGQPIGTLDGGEDGGLSGGPAGGASTEGDEVKLVWGQAYVANANIGSYSLFKKKVIEVSGRLGVDPNWLMSIMEGESRLNPRAVNRQSGAVGLIQFTDIALKQMGETRTKDEIAKMTAFDQLDLVEAYFIKSGLSGKMKDVGDVYAAVFWPAAVGKADEYPMINKPSKAYEQNAALDLNQDGVITRGELVSRAVKLLEDGKKYEL